MELCNLIYEDTTKGFTCLICMSTVSGILITVFTVLVLRSGGAIATNITANIRDIVLTYLGFVLFDDKKPTILVLAGLTTSFCGALFFVYDKYRILQQT